MGGSLALLAQGRADAIVAVRRDGPVRRDEFLRDALAIAGRLPERAQVLNLCADRYAFAAGLFGSIARGAPSHLPHSTAREGIAALARSIPDLVCLTDGADPGVPGLPLLRVGPAQRSQASGSSAAAGDPGLPQIPADRLVAHVYTSGSTGTPRAHRKTFGHLREGVQGEAQKLRRLAGEDCSIVGTVPFQHMYGLESTVLLPLLGLGRITPRRPLLPADIAEALAEVPRPRVLVTTPFHLRKLLESEVAFPEVAALLSATAPLEKALAAASEDRFCAPLLEIYGSTETGQVASRETAREDGFLPFPGVTLAAAGGATRARGPGIEGEETLLDVLEWSGEGRFQIVGRSADLIEMAGKRGSLAHLNAVIASIPGVREGVFHAPQTPSGGPVARLAAFAVAPGLRREELLAALRERIDPAFLPRPLVLVEALPRDGNGKITVHALEELAARAARRP